MAYTAFNNSTPDPATQTPGQCFDSDRQNLHALRDAVVTGAMAGWDLTPSGGTAEQPTTLKYNRGTSEYLKVALTWGTSGGADGNVTQAVLSYSTDDVTYDTIGTETITYDANGNVTAVAWS